MLKKIFIFLACCQSFLTEIMAHNDSLLNVSNVDVIGKFEGPTDIAATDRYVYVCNLVGKSVQVIDIKSNEVVTTIQDKTMTAPFKIAIINGYAYICNLKSNKISIVDVINNIFVKTIDEDLEASNGITVASVSGKPFAFVVDVGMLQILDLTSPKNPRVVQTYEDHHINGLGVSVGEAPDYSIYVTACSDDCQGQLLAYYQIGGVYSRSPIIIDSPEIEGGRWFNAITIVRNSYAYVCDSLNDVVQVYDLKKQCYLTSIDGFNTPSALTYDGAYVYVCNFTTSDDSYKGSQKIENHSMVINVIDAARHAIKASVSGFYSPQALIAVPNASETFYVINASSRSNSGKTGTSDLSAGVSIFRNKSIFSSQGIFL
ncbi:MAG: hypothetical protein WCG10_07690 [Chlamydiota bacterium]